MARRREARCRQLHCRYAATKPLGGDLCVRLVCARQRDEKLIPAPASVESLPGTGVSVKVIGVFALVTVPRDRLLAARASCGSAWASVAAPVVGLAATPVYAILK
jgi:hypothetical protein